MAVCELIGGVSSVLGTTCRCCCWGQPIASVWSIASVRSIGPVSSMGGICLEPAFVIVVAPT